MKTQNRLQSFLPLSCGRTSQTNQKTCDQKVGFIEEKQINTNKRWNRQISNGINTYVRPKLNNLGLLLPSNFDCRILFDLVKSKAKEIVHLYLEVFQGLVEQIEAAEKVVPYNVENIIFDNVEDCPEEETVALNTVKEKNLYEFGRLIDKTFSDGEESNEGWSEDEFIHRKKASDIFYGMPPIPDCADPIVELGPFHNLGPNDDMFVRQTYDNKQ
ncbi:unnamed protein product [Lactuca saligna]|uniref:Uncharacterized protein n=1 Tax=Lactuca saligna TaxID=75948 RepID=A0AA35ZDY9_LACSI|nr:unnamed protein product [Lactuca saligna]